MNLPLPAASSRALCQKRRMSEGTRNKIPSAKNRKKNALSKTQRLVRENAESRKRRLSARTASKGGTQKSAFPKVSKIQTVSKSKTTQFHFYSGHDNSKKTANRANAAFIDKAYTSKLNLKTPPPKVDTHSQNHAADISPLSNLNYSPVKAFLKPSENIEPMEISPMKPKRTYNKPKLYSTPTDKVISSTKLKMKTTGLPNHKKSRQRRHVALKDISNVARLHPLAPVHTNSEVKNSQNPHSKLSPECEHHIRILIGQGISAEHIRKDVCGRHSLDVNSKVMIFSVSQTAWFSGIVTAIHHDVSSGEWLKVEYGRMQGRGSSKLVKRFDKEIMPFPCKPDSMSNDEGRHRENWTIGSDVEVHSHSQKRWISATVVSVDYDREGEWLRLLYVVNQSTNRRAEKQVKRFSQDVRPPKRVELSFPIPTQPSDPVIEVESPLPFDSDKLSRSESESNIPLWAKKENVLAWISEVQDNLDPEEIFPTDSAFRQVDLANMFDKSIILETQTGQRAIGERRETGDWSDEPPVEPLFSSKI